MAQIKVVTVFGTRPEAIKMAPVCKALAERGEFHSVCCVTGQHRNLLPPILRHYGITPQYDLQIMSHGQTLTDITSRVLLGLDDILKNEAPDLLMCHGDPTTAFAAALAAFYKKIPVGHVEAGLRTYERYSPYPEEMNRSLISRIASLHFAPTAGNRKNLAAEGITDGVYVTGNTVIDAINSTTLPGYVFKTPMLAEILAKDAPVALLTAHRRENYGRPLENICRAVRRIAADFPDMSVVYPVHPGAHVRRTVFPMLEGVKNVYLTEPIDVFELHQLLARCRFVMTDSGGLQEEAPALGKPVLVLRNETERPEAVAAGTVMLVGVEEEPIVRAARALMTDPELYERMSSARNPYGDGHASERITSAVLWHFGLSDQEPRDFAS
ncbi:MAG: UDP-N-acetylglucosamine 2-epimerase (non-hydrolyzing) [Oscillospiraceae bacterium]|nr:UDP-N-acetylglucosamine 2-epimerase (non-hydrolyzing) [Oscillospiraceae bacterium]